MLYGIHGTGITYPENVLYCQRPRLARMTNRKKKKLYKETDDV